LNKTIVILLDLRLNECAIAQFSSVNSDHTQTRSRTSFSSKKHREQTLTTFPPQRRKTKQKMFSFGAKKAYAKQEATRSSSVANKLDCTEEEEEERKLLLVDLEFR
jgi:hypothetical protein